MKDPENQISKKGLTVWRIHGWIESVIVWLIFVGISIGIYYLDVSFAKWLYGGLLVIAILFTICFVYAFPKIRWHHWRYEVREEEIELKYGLFVIERVLVPMIRVQHVNMTQGPILKKYHLAEIAISTAATVHKIPALTEEEAEELRVKISTLARVAEDDV